MNLTKPRPPWLKNVPFQNAVFQVLRGR